MTKVRPNLASSSFSCLKANNGPALVGLGYSPGPRPVSGEDEIRTSRRFLVSGIEPPLAGAGGFFGSLVMI